MIRFDPSQKYDTAALRLIALDLKTDMTKAEQKLKNLNTGCSSTTCAECNSMKDEVRQEIAQIRLQQEGVGRQL